MKRDATIKYVEVIFINAAFINVAAIGLIALVIATSEYRKEH